MAERLKVHPAAKTMPKMNTDDFAELVASIGAHGLQNPSVLHGATGVILDGIHRYDACLELGVEPFAELVSDIAANGLREPITRHPDGSILDGHKLQSDEDRQGTACER